LDHEIRLKSNVRGLAVEGLPTIDGLIAATAVNEKILLKNVWMNPEQFENAKIFGKFFPGR
jgi:hypothetical protein